MASPACMESAAPATWKTSAMATPATHADMPAAGKPMLAATTAVLRAAVQKGADADPAAEREVPTTPSRMSTA